jgi:hypothetical protein
VARHVRGHGRAAAALTGLIFVAVSINLEPVLKVNAWILLVEIHR